MNGIEEFDILEEGVRAIGEKAKDFWRRGVTGKLKSSHHDIVTEADTILEKDIRILISDKFPGAKILGEESGGETGPDYWTVDPIDGTSSFAAGLPTWSVVIGRLVEGIFTFAMIYIPLGIDGPQLFYAKKGKGAYMNGEKLSVSQKTELKEANLYMRAREIREDKEGKMLSLIAKTCMLWIPGSTSLALAYAASGKLDIVISKNQSVWDSPGTLIVGEAGGKVTFFEDKNQYQKIPARHSILATNSALHDTVLNHILA